MNNFTNRTTIQVTMSNLTIAIIGAGPAGLTLARLLQVNNIPCTVYELDSSATDRDQGGTVDLHASGGQLVLKEAGLSDEFRKISRPEGEAMKLVKYDGTVLFDENVAGNSRPEEFSDRPEVDRAKLRQLLLNSVAPGTVIWNKRLVSIQKSTEVTDTHDLHFADGIEKGFDVVVGADGAWSKIRAFITPIKPFYSGITAIELWALDVDSRKKFISDFVGVGTMFMFDEGRAIISQKNGEGSIRTYVAVRQPESWINDCGIDWSKAEEAKKKLIERYFANCGDDLKQIVTESDDALIPRVMHMLPVGVKWDTCPGVSIIGDAAHLMTPFAGVGVNLAMVDALNLSKALASCAGDKNKVFEALGVFEAEMQARAGKFAQKTWNNMQCHFSTNGGEERANQMKAHRARLAQ
jgi:2-polyprenyl-6-methoxyphenol hydroxylase-like FAD-dependent oxidoreductase